MIEIKIPFKTPTVNHLYFNWNGRMIKTKIAKDLDKAIKQLCEDYIVKNIIISGPETKLKVSIEIHEDWFCKDGRVKKKDLANREKFMIDSIFKGFGLEDKFIFEHEMKKIQDTEEFAIVKIDAIEKEETNKCGNATGS